MPQDELRREFLPEPIKHAVEQLEQALLPHSLCQVYAHYERFVRTSPHEYAFEHVNHCPFCLRLEAGITGNN
jgi:hypothetical protein